MNSRIFHPIGQGAFYSERILGKNIVFDCGVQHSERNSARVDHLIKNSFDPESEIDILFISHFDCDHVNKVRYLHANFPIKRIVLPLLHQDEKIRISNGFKLLGDNDAAAFVLNPEALGSKITSIKPATDGITDESGNEYSLEDIPVQIESGSKIRIDNWVYIPYNHEYEPRSTILQKKLKTASIDEVLLSSDTSYFEKHRSKLKKIYNSIKGKINQNSLFLYSGPENRLESNLYLYVGEARSCSQYCYHFASKKIGCIYTGDGDLNLVDISAIYRNRFQNVGTIQIPHHGDLSSFNVNVFQPGRYYCPISYGVNNTYGHPSNQLIHHLLESRCDPISVTEKCDSFVFQIFD